MHHLTHLARLVATMALLLQATSHCLAAPANKCVIDGQVTYQQGPCPTGQARRPPTVDELNALEKQRRAAVTTKASTPPPTTSTSTPTPPAALTGFRCDGRQHCSQMKSCAEAKYFLAHCPGVKMDGDNDGSPCELDVCR
ncbi:excalibur calcium-binding domain-containing protein [Paucibacter sp. PLA-PC-4]|uniref:excalibur calcium-binding domain-containing protein n=1 Tax=Paucibacter sp. PLA-PC-4 TaxID=2993655 RepID=UPI002249423F|nr:excalibur calcium-binding domain-containing protein [Paucibacter sp. PLA-PC-4]MCX2862317.1 excalibur calcium-binding domain-containing protein [Paucibacter sp. PLA-PC-4]